MNFLEDRAVEFAGFVLCHCAIVADDFKNGQLICPFAVLADCHGQLRVVGFESNTQSEAVDKGWASLEEARETEEWWGFGREGLVRTDKGLPLDVFVVSVWTPEQEVPFTVTQSFGRSEDASLYLMSPPELSIGGREGAQVQALLDYEALLRGIQQHPHGSKWEAWKRYA